MFVILLLTLLFVQLICPTVVAENMKCLAQCSVNDYKPICIHGISYANFCILKNEICRGKLDIELLKDVEECPKFNKKADEEGDTTDGAGLVYRKSSINDH